MINNKRLRIINNRKSLTHHKQWYKGKRRKLKVYWTIDQAMELECHHGLNLENELCNILKQEITIEFRNMKLGNPYPDNDILEFLTEHKEIK